MFCLSSVLDVNFNIAARLVHKLRGAARRIGMNMTDDELDQDPPSAGTDGAPLPRTRAQHLAGVKRLLEKLEVLAPRAQSDAEDT